MTSMRSGLTAGVAAGFLGLVTLGGLSACDDKDVDQTQGSGAASGESSSEQASDSTTGDSTDAPAAQSASSTGCLVGTWLADNQQLGALFKSAAAGTAGAGSVSDPTGAVLVTFGPEGQYSTNYDAWTLTLAQQGVTVELVRNGTDTGRYDASDDGAVEWTEVAMGSVASMETPAGTQQLPASAPATTSGTFTCEQDALEITADGSTTALQRQ